MKNDRVDIDSEPNNVTFKQYLGAEPTKNTPCQVTNISKLGLGFCYMRLKILYTTFIFEKLKNFVN